MRFGDGYPLEQNHSNPKSDDKTAPKREPLIQRSTEVKHIRENYHTTSTLSTKENMKYVTVKSV
jgi:hypothetical protein